MNILILGGTVFLGRALVNSALTRNHNITLFNRGIHNPEIFPEAEKLTGDRNGNLDALKGRTFDAVIDTCGHVPRIVRESAELLKDSTAHYTFISSISAYKDFSKNGINEDSEAAVVTDGKTDEMTMENYGPLKALCEKAVEEVYKDRALNIRPGLIVGENDWSDRFTYWIHRISQGGKVLAPDAKKSHTQFIDVKDLADWIIKMSEEKKSGLYNATGPDYNLTLEKLFDECRKVSGSDAEIVWVSEKYLADENVTPWTEIPLWVQEEDAGVNNVDVSKAIKHGLKFRPLAETLKDTLEFDKTRKDYTLRAGLKADKEVELLSKWTADFADSDDLH
ncbi:MAG: NAD-dependent epimerase/dehydratase family protein [Bacteroidota bacterium]|nr:NAD-dependent epimerase/dehydratase family protein [Bacteroidota bacterium]